MYSYKIKKNPDTKNKYKYLFNSKSYDVDVNSNNGQKNLSFDERIGATRANPDVSVTFPDKIKSNGSFTLERITKKDVNL